MRQEVVGLEALQNLAAALYGQRDPIPPLASQQPLRFYMEGNQYVLALRLTGVPSGAIDLTRRGDELRVRIGNFKRAIALPRYVAGLQPTWASIEGDHLKVVFEEAAR
jgi:arsenite-transporting ATPase